MTREQLERHQVWVYLGAITLGLVIGARWPAAASTLDLGLWPVLGILLYATFTQVPLTNIPDALRDARFVGAVLAGNFLFVPLLVALLLTVAPAEPAVRVGVLLVLLVPCTDWFVTFTHLGGGDTRRALAVTPVNLVVQFAALPVLLWIFMGRSFIEILAVERLALVFATLIALPLVAAYVTERAAERRPARKQLLARLGWLPVPLLALVVFLIAASQVPLVVGSTHDLGRVVVVFVLYLVGAAVLGAAMARVLDLPTRPARTLVFSLGTRNSFVVLPFALALPEAWSVASVVIVVQSLVELWGMAAYLWIVPRVLRHTDA